MIRRVLEAIDRDDRPPTAEYESVLEKRGWKAVHRETKKSASYFYPSLLYVESTWEGPIEGLRITIETENVIGDTENNAKAPPEYVRFNVESQHPLMRSVGQDPNGNRSSTGIDHPTVLEMLREIRGIQKRHGLKYVGKQS